MVKCEKIDFNLQEYEIKYLINSDLTSLYVQVIRDQELYNFSYELATNESIMDVIDNKIYKKLELIGQKLSLIEVSTFTLIKGMQVRDDKEYKVSIVQKKPRSELSVVFQGQEATYRSNFLLINLLTHLNSSYLEPQYVFSCFSLANEEIALEYSDSSKLDLLYYKYHALNNNFSYYLKISAVNYDKAKYFLIEGVHDSSPEILPILINTSIICKYLDFTDANLYKNLEKISGLISIRNSQILICHKHEPLIQVKSQLKSFSDLPSAEREAILKITVKIQRIFRRSRERKHLLTEMVYSIKKLLNDIEFTIQITDSPSNQLLMLKVYSASTAYTAVFSYPIFFKLPFRTTIPDLITFHNKVLVIKNPKSNTAFLFTNTTEYQIGKKLIEISLEQEILNNPDFPPEYYNIIHFRTCVVKKKVVRQISMTLIKSEYGDDLLEFSILSGSGDDNWKRLKIDLKTVCDKSGINKNALLKLGDYIVKNLLFFGEGNMACIEFKKNNEDREQSMIKIQAAVRGKILRNRIKIEKKILLTKKKVRFGNRLWTVLMYKSATNYYIYLVKKFVVIRKKLDFFRVNKEGIAEEYDFMLVKAIISEIKVVKKEGKWDIEGIEKYEE